MTTMTRGKSILEQAIEVLGLRELTVEFNVPDGLPATSVLLKPYGAKPIRVVFDESRNGHAVEIQKIVFSSEGPATVEWEEIKLIPMDDQYAS